MSQSVKLKDGSYIDASGVWDANQSTDLQSYIETLSNEAHIKQLGGLSTANADVRAYFNDYPYCAFLVFNKNAGYTIQNWIGNVDGFVIRLSNLAFAVDGWNKKLYYSALWSTTWGDWTLIS